MAKFGGKQPGAGRPKGSTNRPSIFDYWDAGDIEEFFEFLKDNYKEDMRLMQWVGDHLLGKPQQNVDVTTMGKELPVPIMHVLPNNSDKEDSSAQ